MTRILEKLPEGTSAKFKYVLDEFWFLMSLGIFNHILEKSNSMGISYEESSLGINSLSRFSESTVRILEILENVAGRTKSTTFATLTLSFIHLKSWKQQKV